MRYQDGDQVDVDIIIASAATAVARKYAGYVDRDDLVQEGWLWWYEDSSDRRSVDKLVAEGTTRKAAWLVQRRVWRAMEKFARTEKAAQSGYSTADEAFYSSHAICSILPAVLLEDPEVGPLVEGVTGGRRAGDIVAKTDPAEGGTWMAMYADVTQAWETADLSDEERDTLIALFEDQYTQSEAATKLGVTQGAVSKRLHSALRKLSEALGGATPWDRSDETEEALRRRPGTVSGHSGMEQEVTR